MDGETRFAPATGAGTPTSTATIPFFQDRPAPACGRKHLHPRKSSRLNPQLVLVALLVALNTVWPQPKSTTSTLTDEVLRYRMKAGRTVVGEMTTNISRDEARGIIHVLESVSGLFERSTVLTLRADSLLTPLSSHTVIVHESEFQEIRLRYAGGRVTGAVQLPPALGGSRQVNTTLENGTTDFYAVAHLFRTRPLAVNQVLNFNLYDPLQDRRNLVRGWVAKVETLIVPAGVFSCHRVEGFSGAMRWVLNIETAAPHRVIRQILPALDLELELVETAANHRDLSQETFP